MIDPNDPIPSGVLEDDGRASVESRIIQFPVLPDYDGSGIVAGDKLPLTAHPNFQDTWSASSSLQAFTDLGLADSVTFRDLTVGGPRDAVDGWRASSLGYCRRKSYYGRMQAPKKEPSASSKGKFLMGHLIEAVVVAAMQADPRIEWLDAQMDLYDEEYNLHGHCDARIRRLDRPDERVEVIEIKSMNSNAFRYAKELPKPYHRLQTGSYLWLLRRMGYEADHGRVIYVSKDNWQLAEPAVGLTPALTRDVLNEVDALNELWEAGVKPRRLPRLLTKNGRTRENYKCGYCDYKEFCFNDND